MLSAKSANKVNKSNLMTEDIYAIDIDSSGKSDEENRDLCSWQRDPAFPTERLSAESEYGKRHSYWSSPTGKSDAR